MHNGWWRHTLGLMIFAVWSALASADFTQAMRSYESKHYAEARQHFLQLAALGHKDSQFNLGAMYLRGEGVDADPVEAFAWIALSASGDQGQRAQLRDRLFARLGRDQKPLAEARVNELFAHYSDEVLRHRLQPVYRDTASSPLQLIIRRQSQPVYPRQARRLGLQGSVDIIFDIDAKGVTRRHTLLTSTNSLFDEAALTAIKNRRYQPYPDKASAIPVYGVRERVYFRLNQAFDPSYSGGSSMKKLVADLHHEALGEVPLDMFNYAFITEMLAENPVSWDEINRWYFAAARNGLAHAQYQLGRNLLYGKGCELDPAKAAAWLGLAAEGNYAPAQLLLAEEALAGRLPDISPAVAVQWLEAAAANGYAEAVLRLAWHLATTGEDESAGQEALQLLEAVPVSYPDQHYRLTLLAASQAAAGQFEAAVKTQREVIRIAKKEGYRYSNDNRRLHLYNKKQAWREAGVALAETDEETDVEASEASEASEPSEAPEPTELSESSESSETAEDTD